MSSVAKEAQQRVDMLILRTLLWTCSRSPDREAHSEDHERFSADAARLALSGAAPPGTARMGCLQMGDCTGAKSGIQIQPLD